MSGRISKYTNKGIYRFYSAFVCLLLLLVGAVVCGRKRAARKPEK